MEYRAIDPAMFKQYVFAHNRPPRHQILPSQQAAAFKKAVQNFFESRSWGVASPTPIAQMKKSFCFFFFRKRSAPLLHLFPTSPPQPSHALHATHPSF
jgi:hypothetical protein